MYHARELTSVFLCVRPVIDHEFRHNIVKVAVDPFPRDPDASVVILFQSVDNRVRFTLILFR